VRDVPTDICYEAVCANHADVLTGNATVIDLVSGRRIAQLARRDKDQAERPYAVSTDGALAVGGLAQPNGPAGGGVWEAHTGKFVMQFPTRWWFGCVAFHPDGRHIAINGLDDDVYLVDVTTGKTVATFPMPEKIPAGTTKGSYVNCMAFAPDGRRLATGHPDGSILLWEVKLPRRPPAALGAGEAEALWADLAHADAARAWRAVWRLSDSPDAALPLARKHLQPVLPAPAAVTRPLVADLDSDDFTKRAAATTGLRKLGFRAVPALEVQRAGNVSVEAKRRIAALLEEMEKAPSDRTPEALAHLRAVAALARMESPAARTALAELAKGVRLAPVTRAAQAALGR
jgi:hypothetical protein